MGAMDNHVISRLDRDDPLIAVVGATDSPGKYGGIIYRHLKQKGYRVVGVNPGREVVDGDSVFPSVGSLPEQPDIVNVVIPPSRTLELIDEVEQLDDPAIWIQPGAADSVVRTRLGESSVPSLVDSCIMVIAKRRF
jgi:hypothetical protein